jgi:hypothetical protein
VSTPHSSGRHDARRSDPWPGTDVPPLRDDRDVLDSDRRDDRDSPYYRALRDLGDDRDSPYRELRDLGDDRDPPYRDLRDDRDPFYDEPTSSGAVRHLLSAFFCLVLTPIGIASMTYGADRYWHLTLEAGAERDLRGLVALGVGAGLLLIAACLAALSPVGPVLSGVIWGLAPAGLYLLYPRDISSEVADLPILPDSALSGAVTWMGYAAFLVVGALLLGSGFAAAMRRPTRR